MPKKSILILFILIVNISIAQVNKAESRWKIGLNYSPDISYRISGVGSKLDYGSSSDAGSIFEHWGTSVRPHQQINFTGKLSIEYDFNNNTSLSVGIHYTNEGKRTIINSNSTYYYPPAPGNFETRMAKTEEVLKYRYVGIPILFSHIFLQRKNSKFYFSAGVSLDYLISYSKKTDEYFTYTYITSNNFEVHSDESFSVKNKNFYPKIISSLGYGIQLSEKFEFRIEPTFRLSLKSIEVQYDDKYKEHYFNLGLNFGLYYKI